jgi:hypothetical protein
MIAPVLIGLILGALGLTIIVGFCALLWKNLPFGKNTSFSLRGWLESTQLTRAEKSLAAFEQAFRAQQPKLARALLPQTVVVAHVQSSIERVEAVTHHHLEVLDLLVRLADENTRRIENVGALEALFVRRSTIMREFLEIRRGRATLAERRRSKGKQAPEWALEDFQRRQSAIIQDLKASSSELRKELLKALDSLEREVGQSITYH